MHSKLKTCILASAALGLASGLLAEGHAAEAYPEEPVTLVVAFSPGGSSDTLARVLAPNLGDVLGQTVVVENRPGASGYVAWRSIEAAEPDGYTVLLAENAMAINTALRPEEPLDPRQAFDAIGHIGTAPLALNIYGGLPVETVEELVEYSENEEINFGSSGVGSVSHMTMEAVADATGIRAQHIPYRGGGELRAALLGGHTHVSMSSIGGSVQMAEDGDVRPIAVGSEERVEALPDVPTLRELGYETDVAIEFWWGLFVPAGTPDEIKAKLESALQEALDNPELIDRMAGIEVEARFSPAAEMATVLDSEITNWSAFVQEKGITVD